MGCSHSTIVRPRQRHDVTGSVADGPRPLRQKVTSQRQDRHGILVHLRDRFRPAAQTPRETPGVRNPRVRNPTIKRRLRHTELIERRPFTSIMTMLCVRDWSQNIRNAVDVDVMICPFAPL